MTTPAEGQMPWFRRGLAVATGALAAVGIAWLAMKAVNVIGLVFMALLLAAGLEPLLLRLRAHLRVGRAGGILLAYGVFLASVVALAFLVVPIAMPEVQKLTDTLPAQLANLREWATTIRPAAISSAMTSLIDAVRGGSAVPPTPQPDQVVAVGLTAAEAIVSVVTVLTLVFFWLTEHARLQRYVLSFAPAERRAGIREAWDAVETQLGMWVRGQLMIMAAIAAATTVIYTLLGLPSALLLGLFAGLAEAIPLVGPFLGAVPAILIAFTVSPQLVGVVLVAYLIIQFIEGNVLVPMIMRNSVRLSSFLVVASLLVGAAVDGITGAFFAVPIVAAAEVLLARLQARDVPVAQAPPEPASADAGSDPAAGEAVLEVAPGVPSAGSR